jgi:hypothetical protein
MWILEPFHYGMICALLGGIGGYMIGSARKQTNG